MAIRQIMMISLYSTGTTVATNGFLITEIDGRVREAILIENFDVGAWAFFAGLASCVAGIPFFISPHDHCKKVTLRMKHIQIETWQVSISKKILRSQ